MGEIDQGDMGEIITNQKTMDTSAERRATMPVTAKNRWQNVPATLNFRRERVSHNPISPSHTNSLVINEFRRLPKWPSILFWTYVSTIKQSSRVSDQVPSISPLIFVYCRSQFQFPYRGMNYLFASQATNTWHRLGDRDLGISGADQLESICSIWIQKFR